MIKSILRNTEIIQEISLSTRILEKVSLNGCSVRLLRNIQSS